MTDMQIVRPRLEFEREFGQHRNWWVRDPRIVGNPLSILLFLLSHEAGRRFTQTEARETLELGERAWVTAKKALLKAGFLVEVRDRFPEGHIDGAGRPRGQQRRFRLFLQDPAPDTSRALSDAVIELDQPYEEWLEHVNSLDPAKCRVEATPDSAKCRDGEKPQVTPSPQNADTEVSTLHNAGSFIGRENHDWLVGSLNSSNQPTNQVAGAREADIDEALAALHPDLRLTFAQIHHEVNGRVDLAAVDVVRAVEETVIRAAARGQRVDNPARYAASVIVRSPKQWMYGAEDPAPFEALAVARSSSGGSGSTPAADCASGNHWWGTETWAEIDRSHCVHCGSARRSVDSAFAELEAELQSVGGGL